MVSIKNLIIVIENQIERATTDLVKLLAISNAVGEIRKNELSHMSLHINVISISAQGKLKETAHSSILQHLLKYQRILDSFTKDIMELNNIQIKSSKVRPAEQERIDISIYDENICIIIENKINNATEQPGQIFRYVQVALNNGYKEDEIRVLYLNSSHHSKPSDYSLTENGEGINRIPKVIEDKIIIKDYAHDIYTWIKKLPALLSDNEKYLHSALLQYQDYLEEYFYLTDKFENMKELIKLTITSDILNGLSDENDSDFSERISRLKETSENLQLLQSEVNDLIFELSFRKDAINIGKELRKINLELIDLSELGYERGVFGVKIAINEKCGYLAYGYANHKYIGFAFNSNYLTQTEKSQLCQLFKCFGKDNYGEEERWPCWNWIGKTSLLYEFVDFVQCMYKQAQNDEKYPITFK